METEISNVYPASSLPRFTIVRSNGKDYVLENKHSTKWANLMNDEDGVRKGVQITGTQMLEVVSYPAQSAFELLKIKGNHEALLSALKAIARSYELHAVDENGVMDINCKAILAIAETTIKKAEESI